MIFPLAILAGGLATRLRPLTETIPKALIDVNGEPFIAHQLRLLRSRGIRDVVLCVGHLGEQIEKVVGRGERWDVSVAYSFDGPQLLGTAGALKKAELLLSPHFFVLYGDSYLDFDPVSVRETYERSGKLALMTVYKNEGHWDTSNVEFRDGRILAYRKKSPSPAMRHIDYGLGLLSRKALEAVPPAETYDLALLYEQLLASDQLAAYECKQRFYEVGSTAGIEELRRHLAEDPSPEQCSSPRR